MSEALIQSLELMAIGMIVIFIFMGALIIIIHYFVKFAAKFFPDREKEEGPKDSSAGSGSAAGADGAIVAAISAAIGQRSKIG